MKPKLIIWALVLWGLVGAMPGRAQSANFLPVVQVDRLKQAQKYYQLLALSTKWLTIDPNICLVACEKDPNVAPLKINLKLTGDLPLAASETDSLFDNALVEAVKRFQRRHGLVADGIVGPNTLEALNVPPAQRLSQIELNLRRWQMAQEIPAQRMVWVNLPDFTLHLLDSTGEAVWQTRVIIGQINQRYQTIPMDSRIGHLVVNPTWTVPQSILRREILPLLAADPNYLTRNEMIVFRVDGTTRTQVPASELVANVADVAKEKYWVVQQPGKVNALGKLKFMFPNPHDIYLHDTPNRQLFAQPVRAYSHGCVRVQNPELLGTYLLSPDWNAVEKVSPLLHQRTPNQTIYLPKPVAVKLGYFTAWVDELGQLQFRDDLYGLDKQAQKSPTVFQ